MPRRERHGVAPRIRDRGGVTGAGRRSWWRLAAALLAGALLAAGAGTGTRFWLDARDDLDRTAGDLAATRRSLEATRQDLGDETAALLAAEDELAAAGRLLTRRTEERDSTTRRLRAVEEILASIEGDLSERQEQIGSSAVALELLTLCLAGAAEALNQASVADTAGLSATLRRIEDVCAAARSYA